MAAEFTRPEPRAEVMSAVRRALIGLANHHELPVSYICQRALEYSAMSLAIDGVAGMDKLYGDAKSHGAKLRKAAQDEEAEREGWVA
jgi:hypothetical protein